MEGQITRLKLSPSACLVFEDAISGVKAAVGAGASCIGVQSADRAAPLLQAGAKVVILDFTAVALHLTSHGDLRLSLKGNVRQTKWEQKCLFILGSAFTSLPLISQKETYDYL